MAEAAKSSGARATSTTLQKRGAERDGLWGGDALRDVRRVLERATTEVPEASRDFVSASVKQEARSRMLVRGALAAVVVLLSIVAIGSVVSTLRIADKEQEARQQRGGSVPIYAGQRMVCY